MTDSERIAEILRAAERRIKIHLGGPVAEQVWRAQAAEERPDAAGWTVWHDPRERVAIHEAGHVLVMYLLGRRPPAVAALIETSATYGGFVSDTPGTERAGLSDRRQIVKDLGYWYVAGADWRGMRAVHHRLTEQTRALLEQHWLAVSAVGARLLDRGELDGADLADIIRATGPRKTICDWVVIYLTQVAAPAKVFSGPAQTLTGSRLEGRSRSGRERPAGNSRDSHTGRQKGVYLSQVNNKLRLKWWEIALAFFAPRFVMQRVQRRAREQAQRAAAARAREYGSRPARDGEDWEPLQPAPGAPADLGGVPLHRPRRERWIARRRWD